MGAAKQVILQRMTAQRWVGADDGPRDGAVAIGLRWRRRSTQTLGGELGIVDTPTGEQHLVILRATQKVLKSLEKSAADEETSDTALGDWYVNRTVVDHKPLLLFVSSRSLLAMVTRAQKVKLLPEHFPDRLSKRLERLDVDSAVIDSEVEATQPVRVGRTRDRSVMGTMVDFAKVLPFYLPEDGWDDRDLFLAELKLAQTPCRCGPSFDEAIWPVEHAVRLLEERWR